MNNSESQVLIITGMHRSGTSLTASLLQSAGLDIGSRLVEASEGNIKGHFEDADFVQLHEKILDSQGITKEGWTLEKNIQVSDAFIIQAETLINQRTTKYWGWKDPRTTLFLNFWQEKIPQAYFLLLYRYPWEVIDSLYRRGDQVFLDNPNLAIDIWINYNEIILDFYKKYQQKCLLININDIITNPYILTKIMREKFSLTLGEITNYYEESLMNKEIANSYRVSLFKEFFPKACEIYQELNTANYISINQSNISDKDLFPSRNIFLEDWKNLHQLNKKTQKYSLIIEQNELTIIEQINKLENTQLKLEDTETILQNTQLKLENTETILQNTQLKLQDTEIILQNTQTKLQDTETILQNTQLKLQNTETILQNTQTKLQDTETMLQNTQLKLEDTETMLQNTQTKLQEQTFIIKESNDKLSENRRELNNLQEELQKTNLKLIEDENIIQGMERSKFWKMRNIWFAIKKRFNLT